MKKFCPVKVTPELFRDAKTELDSGAKTEFVARYYSLGRTTVGIIRHCDTYEEYVKKNQKRTAQRKAKNVNTKPAINELWELERLHDANAEGIRCLYSSIARVNSEMNRRISGLQTSLDIQRKLTQMIADDMQAQKFVYCTAIAIISITMIVMMIIG